MKTITIRTFEIISYIILISIISDYQNAISQTVNIHVDALQGRKAISPYIYGKNGNVSDNPYSPTSHADWQLMRDAGLRFTRENGGNNLSKYNWRLKITSHPDWYNNVYPHDWDYATKTLADSLPGTQGMWGFQLIGKAALNTSNNFNDWDYNQSQWWSGVEQNLAGGGIPNTSGGSNALVNGNPDLYLENWSADSTVGILDHWFGNNGLGLDKNKIQYWSMDNEPEIWNSTHDDVMPTQLTPEEFMQLYFAVAKKARLKYPNIKLCGPIPASEWQWYAWYNNTKIPGNDGLSYTWLEYFIKRISEEETASGIRLLNVIDIHSYPGETSNSDIVQLHRIYFDTTYNYPGANGVKTTAVSGWDNSIFKEYIFERCNQWLNKYMGPNHGVTFGVSEYGFTNNDANVTSVSYASILGTFAENNVEYFSPWYWFPGMWETLHLFSRYAKTTRVQSVSDDGSNVSAYSSVNSTNDSMTVILVNRSLSSSKTVSLNLSNFSIPDGDYMTKQLKSLPAAETFVSHANNALSTGTAYIASNSLTITLPSLSTTAIILKGTIVNVASIPSESPQLKLYPNPVSDQNVFIYLTHEKVKDLKIELYNTLGDRLYYKFYTSINTSTIEIPCNSLPKGVYIVKINSDNMINQTFRFVKM